MSEEEFGRDMSGTLLTGVERLLDPEKIIVSKTDTRGVITYVNDVFLDISGYTEAEVMGKPHNMIRHPDMPRCVFKLLWDTIKKGDEIFAYVVNRAKNGDHYWVFAHVTPCYDSKGELVGYHSSRRAPNPAAVRAIEPIYRDLLKVEKSMGKRDGLEASTKTLHDLLSKNGISYGQFVFSLTELQAA